jgi:hypothetical protein
MVTTINVSEDTLNWLKSIKEKGKWLSYEKMILDLKPTFEKLAQSREYFYNEKIYNSVIHPIEYERNALMTYKEIKNEENKRLVINALVDDKQTNDRIIEAIKKGDKEEAGRIMNKFIKSLGVSD